VVLRCYHCHRCFSVRKQPLHRLALAAQIVPCIHCGTHAEVTPEPRLHTIVDIREDTSAAPPSSSGGA